MSDQKDYLAYRKLGEYIDVEQRLGSNVQLERNGNSATLLSPHEGQRNDIVTELGEGPDDFVIVPSTDIKKGYDRRGYYTARFPLGKVNTEELDAWTLAEEDQLAEGPGNCEPLV